MNLYDELVTLIFNEFTNKPELLIEGCLDEESTEEYKQYAAALHCADMTTFFFVKSQNGKSLYFTIMPSDKDYVDLQTIKKESDGSFYMGSASRHYNDSAKHSQKYLAKLSEWLLND